MGNDPADRSQDDHIREIIEDERETLEELAESDLAAARIARTLLDIVDDDE